VYIEKASASAGHKAKCGAAFINVYLGLYRFSERKTTAAPLGASYSEKLTT
jgi:hypothetical protein